MGQCSEFHKLRDSEEALDLLVETKTAQCMHSIELHFTEKEKRTQKRRKLKRFLSKSYIVMKKSTTGPQCKPTIVYILHVFRGSHSVCVLQALISFQYRNHSPIKTSSHLTTDSNIMYHQSLKSLLGV